MLLGCSYFRQWTDGCLLPLQRDCGGSKGQVEESGYWLVEGWSSQSEEPSWESIKASGSGMEVVQDVENLPVWDVYLLFECVCCWFSEWD